MQFARKLFEREANERGHGRTRHFHRKQKALQFVESPLIRVKSAIGVALHQRDTPLFASPRKWQPT